MPILYWSLEPKVAPAKVWAKGSSSSEMNVSWEPVLQDMNGILLGGVVNFICGTLPSLSVTLDTIVDTGLSLSLL